MSSKQKDNASFADDEYVRRESSTLGTRSCTSTFVAIK